MLRRLLMVCLLACVPPASAVADEGDPRAEMRQAAIDQAETTPPPLPPDVLGAQRGSGDGSHATGLGATPPERAPRGNGPPPHAAAAAAHAAVHSAARAAALDAARAAAAPDLASRAPPGNSAAGAVRGQGANQRNAADAAHGRAVRQGQSGDHGKPPTKPMMPGNPHAPGGAVAR